MSDHPTEWNTIMPKQIQVQKPVRRPAPAPIDRRAPSGTKTHKN